MRLVIGMADIIVSCPSAIAQPTLYHSLHPSFVAFEEATVMKEPEILPILVYLFPIAFGFLGDPKQLGPTIVSTTKENPFRSQLAVSILARPITAGYDVGKMIVQRRLAGDRGFTKREREEREKRERSERWNNTFCLSNP